MICGDSLAAINTDINCGASYDMSLHVSVIEIKVTLNEWYMHRRLGYSLVGYRDL